MSYEIRRGRLEGYRRWNLEHLVADFVLRISCPTCGLKISVHNLDLVDSSGTLRTPLICPYDRCNFHEATVRLVGWDPKELDG